MLRLRWKKFEIKLYQRCFKVVSTSDIDVVSTILFHFQRRINVISMLIYNVETMSIRRWHVGWVTFANGKILVFLLWYFWFHFLFSISYFLLLILVMHLLNKAYKFTQNSRTRTTFKVINLMWPPLLQQKYLEISY